MTQPVQLHSDDLYERLGVPRSASGEGIKRAYRFLVRQYPPERSPEEFKRIREAYETLSNPRSRREYDEQPNPIVGDWITTAIHAMEAKDYGLAERYFKQVLVQAPDLGYVRNLLGLCLLYRKEFQKAVAQFERLLPQPDAPAAWFGNAGHAYHATQRFRDAERAFSEAIRRSADNPVDYYVGLADVLIEDAELDQAADVLERGIKHDGSVDFQDLRYFTKLLEVRLLQRSVSEVDATLQRIEGIVEDEEQRRFAAWKLGLLAQQLIAVGGFGFAETVSKSARRLQPDDEDYFALETISQLLLRKDFSGVDRFLLSHDSFSEGEWLSDLGSKIRDYSAEQKVLSSLKPISAAPTLWTLNGIGTTLYGHRDADAHTSSYVATLYFVFFFIPLAPLACYRVRDAGPKGWSFLGKVPFSQRERIHLFWLVVAVVLFLIFTSVQSDGSSSTLPSTTYTPSQIPSRISDSTPATQPNAGASSYTPGGQTTPSWYDTDKSSLDLLEYDVRLLDSELSSSASELESMKSRIRAIEGGYGLYTTSDPEYQSLIDRYNAAVEEHNEKIERRREKYSEYQSALSSFNSKVDDYNARR